MARRLRQRHTAALSGALIALVILLSQKTGWLQPALDVAKQNQPGLYSVIKVEDGDTVKVNMNGQEETIRLVGVDTPETRDPRKAVQCYGKAATNFTKTLIGTSPVRLESDPLSTNRDRYDRLLRYVYLPDNRLLQAEIIREGYGFAYTSFPFTKSDEFKALETAARAENKGLWGSCETTPNQYGSFTSNDEL